MYVFKKIEVVAEWRMDQNVQEWTKETNQEVQQKMWWRGKVEQFDMYFGGWLDRTWWQLEMKV